MKKTLLNEKGYDASACGMVARGWRVDARREAAAGFVVRKACEEHCTRSDGLDHEQNLTLRFFGKGHGRRQTSRIRFRLRMRVFCFGVLRGRREMPAASARTRWGIAYIYPGCAMQHARRARMAALENDLENVTVEKGLL